jgi:hypothetical protein
MQSKERCGAKLKGGRTECTNYTKGTTVKKGNNSTRVRSFGCGICGILRQKRKPFKTYYFGRG